jgi:hypothetical protein
MKQILLLWMLAAFIGGCASTLQVDICVLERAYLRANPSVLFEVLDSKEKTFRSSQDYLGQKKAELQKQVAAYMRSDPCLFDPKQIDILVGQSNTKIGSVIDSAISKIASGLDKKDRAFLISNPDEQSKLLKEALSLFNQASMDVSRIQYLVADLLNKPRPGCPQQVAQSLEPKAALQETQQQIGTEKIKLQHPLSNDPLASYVVAAPAKAWVHKINHTSAKTSAGNSDIAIVAESSEGFQEYTIKGIRNDASQATRAVFSLLNTTVETIAKAYGVGISSSSGTIDSIPNFTKQTLQAEVDLNRYRRSARLAQVNLLRLLLDQSKSLATPADTTAYKAAITTIQTSFSASKKLLVP